MIDSIGYVFESETQIRIWYKKGDRILNESFAIHNVCQLQFTGLKDKNGLDIYERDILKTEYKTPNDYILAQVVFGDCWKEKQTEEPDGYIGWYCKYCGSKGVDISENMTWCQLNDTVEYISEVIGNVYCNPELLK